MAARSPKLGLTHRLAAALTLVAWMLFLVTSPGAAPFVPPAQTSGGEASVPVRRIVSLVPALTEMVFAIGAGRQVVGVSSFDSFPKEVQSLPKLGALLDPDIERILALRPDLVITYGSQSELEAQFARAGIRTFSYRHGGIATALQTLRELGIATGHAAEGSALATKLQNDLNAIRARVAGRPRPRTLLVMDRQPKTLRGMYVSGGVGFLHEVLEVAGGTNVFADVKRESAQPSQETLLVRAPDVILEVRAQGLIEAGEAQGEPSVWSALASVPAVRRGRIHTLVGEQLVVPGPRLAQAADAFARTLHPEAFR